MWHRCVETPLQYREVSYKSSSPPHLVLAINDRCHIAIVVIGVRLRIEQRVLPRSQTIQVVVRVCGNLTLGIPTQLPDCHWDRMPIGTDHKSRR